MGSYVGTDAWGVLQFLGWMLLVLAVVVGGVLLVSWWRRRRGKGTQTLAVDFTLTICGGLVLLFALSIPFSVVQTMTDPTVTVDDLPFRGSLFDNGFPIGHDAVSSGDARVESLSIGSGSATISGLSMGVRALLAIDDVLWILLAALPAVALGVICFQLLRGMPFARTVTRTLVVSAGVVLVLGLAAPTLDAISKGAASAAALPSETSTAALTEGGFEVTLPWWPVGAALALIAMAAVFRFGAKLQHETEGLV